MTGGLGVEPYNGPLHVVKREKLLVTIVERGALESAENSEIICRVKAKSQSGIASTIKWVIDDGSDVSKGQLLVDLDDSSQQDQLKSQTIELDKAKAEWVKAEQDYEITRSQNFSDIETAKITRTLKELELKKYLGNDIGQKVLKLDQAELTAYLFRLGESAEDQDRIEGDYLQAYNDVDGRIEIARSSREQWLDRASWSRRMVKRGYVSRSQAESDEALLASADISLKKVQGEMKILRRFSLQKDVMKLWSDVKEADRALDRVESQARSKLASGDAERHAKNSVYLQQRDKKDDILEEIGKCRIMSPQDGLAVYFVPDQGRFGAGGQQSIVAQGENVKEGQKLLRIPNLTKMQVNVRVHEAMVSRLRAETQRPTGFSDLVLAGLLINPDIFAQLTSMSGVQDLREAYRSRDFEVVSPGQPARVRVDAYPNRVLRGHVKSVATVPSQTDFLSTDVRVYPTIVSIDEPVENLRPGFSAEVTIQAEESSEDVLTIPIQAVVGNISMGAKRKCFVLAPNGQVVERDIVIGISNIKMVEVQSGLKEGERVVLNPRAILGDNSKLKPAVPSAERGTEGAGPEENRKETGKAEKKKGGKKGARDQERVEQMTERFRTATPAQRRELLNQVPETFREQVWQALRAKGIQVPD